jgi:exodeoxyribonuclease VII large subunit
VSQPSLDLDLGDEGMPTFSVRELADAINGALRRSFFEGVWVRGEIQGLVERNGHVYFSLTDDGEEGPATLAVSLFANVRFRLRPLLQRHRIRLADGQRVRIHGYLDFYPPNGRLTLKMSGIDPRYTLGELALQRGELVRRLVAEGLYDAQAQLALPPVPLRIGLVTSVGSAAWHDVVDELSRSGYGFRVTACDTRVQGEWAPEMVAAAVRAVARRPIDVAVVVRGGGARSDLAAFDTEAVARAVATCPVPVVTGLGHEVDKSVADEVAHLALKTPTACAALLVGRVATYRQRLESAWAAIASRATSALDEEAERLSGRADRGARRTTRSLDVATANVARQADRLVRGGRRAVWAASADLERAAGRARADSRRHLVVATSAVEHRAQRVVRRAPIALGSDRRLLDGLEARVRALDPARALARGWSITRDAQGQVVRSVAGLDAGDELITILVDGQVHSRVEEARGR